MAFVSKLGVIPYVTDFVEPDMFLASEHLQKMMLEVTALNASETFIQPGEQVIVEVNGVLRPLTHRRITQTEVENIICWASDNERAAAELIGRQEIKASYVVKDQHNRDSLGEKKATRFRVAAGRGETRGSRAFQIVMRRINSSPAHMKDSGLPPEVVQALAPKDGVIWVTGATGSGKSTFFSSVVRNVLENDTPIRGNIAMLEEPIEQVYHDIESEHSFVFQIEVGKDVETWEAGIEQLMRRLPKMIVVGETRSRSTAEAVLQAANTGHPVGTTLHTNDVPSIATRLMSFFSDETKEPTLYSVITTARALFNQVRIPKLGGGQMVLREYLVVDADLRADLVRKVNPSNVELHLREALEERGYPMWKAAADAHAQGLISDDQKRFYMSQATKARNG
jgi:defect-in-organelle-trafficking protein DotB